MSTEQFYPHDASSSFNNTQLTLHSVHQRNNTLFEGIFVVQFCRSLLVLFILTQIAQISQISLTSDTPSRRQFPGTKKLSNLISVGISRSRQIISLT